MIFFFNSSDSGKSTLLIFLDLSAAFDTIDHSALLNRLNTSFGFTETALSWLESYLIGRYQLVRIGRHSAKPTVCTPGVPRDQSWGHFCSPSIPHLFLALSSHLIFI